MRLPERFPPDDPREWLNRARSNLALAKNRIPDAYLEDPVLRGAAGGRAFYFANRAITRFYHNTI